MLRLVGQYLKPYRGAVIAVCLLQFIQTLAALYLPTLNADIIDKGVVAGDVGKIWRIGGIMLVVSAVQVITNVIAIFLGARAAMAMGRDIRDGLFQHIMSFSAKEINEFGTPSLITRSTNDVQQVQMLVFMAMTVIVMAPIMLIGGVIMALNQDAGLSLLLVVVVPVLGGTMALVASRMLPYFRSMQKKIDRINAVMREQITGIRVIRAFVKEDAEGERFETANSDLRFVSVRVGQVLAFAMPLVMFIVNIASVGVIWFGGKRISDGDAEVGSIIAFLSYLMFIMMAVMIATMMFMFAPRAVVSGGRIADVLNASSALVPPASPVRPERLRGKVELSDVTFRYPGAEDPVLEDISFTAEVGKTTAIIGSTGSGKTTLVSLIPRLFDASAGKVEIDGVNLKDFDPELLSEIIGYVPQRPYLFTGTVASNLRYGLEEATDEQLWQALEIAQAASFVREMDGGLQAPIAQGGTNVSGGQRQRLAIARAVVRQPSIYLFDDSFSALDYATDAALRAELQTRITDASMIVVAQRVASIRDADQILVLDEGRLVDRGTHDELLESCQTYQEIVSSQLSAEEAR